MKQNKLYNIKNSGFKTPENYFEGLEESVMNQLKLEEKIKESGFKAPDNYFKGIEDTIFEKVKPEPKVISIFSKRNLFYAASIAAVFVLMFSVFINKNGLTFEDLETASIEDYLYIEDIDTYELAALLTEDELNSEYFIETELSDDSIEDYLLENTTIEELIIE